mmetsp:Transcript_7004/g.13932  ORF Transcript_7004/g.13932 Transcript_7004/m.13932 type:complete len:711 (+) Transcript_7004:179-2311(+)|eukprot:CAMPEP_0181304274 /NCGR_PEP_ID=MMETSP1101-20121128/9059_1 /TAXON_ID=46948 /ORGANISM="Rhodomonas abbreviata, Strain Caron Lab Isolate" /LENGTH=710 /DNA_ID=CAMNT_0023410013 /DNA_START=174 /DNA_END=2306 /DNA_ORIENTATION=-
MARVKEVQVLIIDVNPSMGINLKYAKEAMLAHVQQKMIQAPKTEIGLLLVGTDLTYNYLQDDGYENMFMKQEIQQCSLELLKEINQIEPGVDEGDYLDALVVAADMIYKKCEKKTFEKSIVIVTNFALKQKDIGQIDSIAGALRSQDINLTIHGINFTPEDSDDMPDGEKVLRMLARSVESSELIAVAGGDELQGAMATRSVKPTTTFRGIFEVTPHVKLKVWSYPATKLAPFPSLKKRRRATGDLEDTGGISTNRQYVLQDDNDIEIPSENLIKAHKYGSDKVPVSDTDQKNMKVQADKIMQLLAFAPRHAVKQHLMMSNAEVVVADGKEPEPSVDMLAALAMGMHEQQHVAIVRWVKRQNDPPKLYALFPYIDEGQGLYVLHAVKLPFSEDLRRAPFAPLKNAKLEPSSAQLHAMRDFVSALDICKAKEPVLVKKEELDSEAGIVVSSGMESLLVFNPVIQYFYRCVNHKALYGDGSEGSSSSAPPPPNKQFLAQSILPDKTLWDTAASEVELLCKAFKIPVVETGKRKQPEADAATGPSSVKKEDEEAKKPKVEDGGLPFLMMAARGKDTGFDSTNPEAHFEALWKREDLDAHEDAIEQMTKHIKEIVDNSPGERFYAKAIACISKLRSCCDAGRSDEPALFNAALKQLQDAYQSRTDISFWAFLTKEGIQRIKLGNDEEELAAPAVAASAPPTAAVDDDDLFDDAD